MQKSCLMLISLFFAAVATKTLAAQHDVSLLSAKSISYVNPIVDPSKINEQESGRRLLSAQKDSACFLKARFPADGPGTGVEWAKLKTDTLIPLCENWIKENPEDLDAKASLGRLYYKAKRYEDARIVLQSAVDQGHLRAMVSLANLLRAPEAADNSGRSLQDTKAAFALYQGAADAQYPWGLERLAMAYRSGWGIDRDPAKALEIDYLAVEAGAVRSMRQIAIALVNEGDVAEPRPDEAIDWLIQGGEAGDDEAYNQLGIWYRDGKIIPRDYALAVKYFELSRQAGNSAARHNLADLLLNTNDNGDADLDKAVALLEEDAVGGDSYAWNKLGVIFRNGQGVAKDYQKAEHYYEKAIAEDNELAPGNLADLLLDADRKPEPDEKRALQILKDAAKVGNGWASEKLAGFYYYGQHIEKNYVKSREYYEIAASTGRLNAHRMLGYIYLNGRGVREDPEKALDYFLHAAEGGQIDAQYALASFYEYGRATSKDLVKAERWYRKIAFDNPKAFGEDYVGFLVRNEISADDVEIVNVLSRAANLGNGKALAALAWPSKGLQALNIALDTEPWRVKLESISDESTFYTAVEAFHRSNLTEQKSEYAFRLIVNNKQLSLGEKLKAERNFQIDHGLYGLAFDRIIRISKMSAEQKKAAELSSDWLDEFEKEMDVGTRWQSSDTPQNYERLQVLSELGSRGATYRLYLHVANPKNANYDLSKAFELSAHLNGKDPTADIFRRSWLTFRRNRADPLNGDILQQALNMDLTAGQKAMVAYRILKGRWIRPDYSKMADLLREGTDQKDGVARLMMADLLWAGDGVIQDQNAALELIMQLVVEGNSEAAARLGDHYASGAGVPVNQDRALRLYMFADDVNSYEAGAIKMARAAVLGIGMPASGPIATKWLKTADRRGDPDAALWLGQCAANPSPTCYRTIDELANLPYLPQPALDVASLDDRIKALEADKIKMADSGFRGDIYQRANTQLINLGLATGDGDTLQSAFMDRIIYQSDYHLKQEGSTDSFHYNRMVACYWGKAAKTMKFVGRADEALLYSKIAVNYLQKARRKLSGLETSFQDCFLDANGDRYRYLADLLIEQGQLGEAENVLAMLKDYEHTEYVRGPVRGDSSKGDLALNSAEDDAWQNYAATLSSLRDGKVSIEDARSRFAEANGRFRSEFSKLREDAAIADAAALAAGEDSNRVNAARRINVSLIRQLRAFDDRTAALHVVVMPDKLHWIITTAQYQQSITIDLSQIELRKLVAATRESVIYDGDISSHDALKSVYDRAFAPVDAVLRSLKMDRLLVSLDGALRYLPLSALFDGEDFLVRRYAINVIRDRSDISRAPSARPGERIAAFGMSKAAAGFKPLAGVPGELRSIVRNDVGDGFVDGTIRLDSEFDRSSLISALDEAYPVIHLASHFTLAPTSPEQSRLLLGDGNTISLSDLTLDGEFNFFDAELLTLSACQTALSGQRSDGREVDSLAALAQDAGVPAVVASLWSVSDASTALLMREFYQAWLGEGMDKTRAMQKAQLALLDGTNRQFAEPFFWSAFLVLGDGR